MLEIVILIFLTRSMGAKALTKGQPPLRWKLYTIIGWLLAEFVGIGLAMSIIGTEDLVLLMIWGLASAFGGYLLVKLQLDKLPDLPYDDIDNIGKRNDY